MTEDFIAATNNGDVLQNDVTAHADILLKLMERAGDANCNGGIGCSTKLA